jgi:plastocyanin
MKTANVCLIVTLAMFSMATVVGNSFKLHSDADAAAVPSNINTNTNASTTGTIANGVITVNAGGNGSGWDKFTPQNISITAGGSVTWINPMLVEEPHAVTFFTDGKMLPPLVAPFNIPNNTKLTPAIPSPNVEPTIMPDPSNPNNKIVVADNARASSPVAIDSTGANVTYMPPNASYTLKGDESYVNSGWLWPNGQSPPGAPPNFSFTVTFPNPGTYNYICVIHPWMSGTVTVTQ